MTTFRREKKTFETFFEEKYVSFISVALAFQKKLNRMLTLICTYSKAFSYTAFSCKDLSDARFLKKFERNGFM